jgi:ATP-dependent DNA helicase RecG
MTLPEDSARYDDRKTVRSNIIQAYRQMLDFVVKYLPDKFYLPDNGSTARLDLRVQIFREIIGNICAHSDYQPGFGGYVEVFYDRVITKNATRLIPTMKEGSLTLDELGPYTKNPLIVKVLNELHFVEDLGSGRRNLKRYAPLYYPDYKIEISNGNQFEFSITYDDLSRGKANETANNTENQHNKEMQSQNDTPNEIAVDTARASSKANINAVYNAIKANTDISVDDICRICKISRATAARAIAWLKENKYIDRTTANQYGSWIILK